MAGVHSYEPKNGHGLRHNPFNALLAPRPIGWISTISADGVINLAPYSYFNAVSSTPPILMFSVSGEKDTLINARAGGEFVANMVSQPFATAMNETSSEVSPDIDEMRLADLESEPSTFIRPPRVKGVPAAFECKVVSIIPVIQLDGVPSGYTLVIGQVVAVHIDQGLIKDGLFDTAGAALIARCGYKSDYLLASKFFEMSRPAINKPYPE